MLKQGSCSTWGRVGVLLCLAHGGPEKGGKLSPSGGSEQPGTGTSLETRQWESELLAVAQKWKWGEKVFLENKWHNRC